MERGGNQIDVLFTCAAFAFVVAGLFFVDLFFGACLSFVLRFLLSSSLDLLALEAIATTTFKCDMVNSVPAGAESSTTIVALEIFNCVVHRHLNGVGNFYGVRHCACTHNRLNPNMVVVLVGRFARLG